MKIRFETEVLCFKNEKQHLRVFYLALLPSVTYRHVTGDFGDEYNLYLSWLAWCVTITLTRR